MRFRFVPLLRRCFAGALALLALGAPACAQAPILDFTGGSPGSPGGDTIAGVEFRVSAPITINALGLWDDGADGLSHAHDVGLWNFDGSVLLASTTVSNASTPVTSVSPDGRWLAQSISDITLNPGVYVLGATFLDADPDAVRVGATAVGIPGVTFVTARQRRLTSTLTFPDQEIGGINDGIFGPNAFRVVPQQAIPEPGTLALLLVGTLTTGAGVLRRRRG